MHNKISIINIPQLKDNYAYIIQDKKNAVIIDPAESLSIINYIKNNNLNLLAILVTHHHDDHTSGIKDILKFKSIPVFSPNKNIIGTSNVIKNESTIDLDFIKFEVIETPGHTMDHIVFYNIDNNLLFSGDTLFRLGCGRVFEGTYNQMYNSLNKILNLDNETMVYCGHEYTISNLNFLMNSFPNILELIELKNIVNKQIIDTGSSIPFKLGLEKKIQSFFINRKQSLY